MSNARVTKNETLLLETLHTKKQLTTEEASALLGVSPSTVRRLFIELSKKGSVLRTFGGVCKNESGNTGYSFAALDMQRTGSKKRIAHAAAGFIKEGDVIYLDGGTTLSRLAQEIALQIKVSKLKDITVFTNSLVNLKLLEESCSISLIGGTYRANRKDTCGFLAEETVKCLHFTACFLGADAFRIDTGFTTTDFDTARLNSLVVQMSDSRYMLLDSAKFGQSSFVRYAEPQKATLIITDNELSTEQEVVLRDADCPFLLA